MSKIFVGVAWPYVNGDLHPGHIAGNFLPADIFARFQRYLGNEVLMVSGSDCYGTPITVEADKRGKPAEQIVAEYHPHHLELFKQYGISFDLYTQTTTQNHAETTQEMLLNLARNGYLLKQKTKQYFSAEDNKFLPDRYVEGECKFCGYKEARGDQCDQCGRVLEYSDLKNPVNKLTKKSVTLRETEHLFLNWPLLQPFLDKYVDTHGQNWKSWIFKEVAGWLKKGLQPRAITRDINWGVKIPNEKLPKELQLENFQNKRIYVWFEAVIGYLSAAKEYGKNWQEFWHPEKKDEVKMYNFMGKDNVVFHCLFWPGQLYGAYGDDIKLPDVISANQYLNLEGQKFSKSRGITIDSLYLAKTYGADPVRFYLTYIMPENSDADFSWEGFVDFNNNILIGIFGNFINRVLKLSENLKLVDKFNFDNGIEEAIHLALQRSYRDLSKCDFKLYSHEILLLASVGNKYINDKEPWRLDKNSGEYLQIMSNCLVIVLALQALLKPLIPEAVVKLEKLTGVEFAKWPDLNTVIAKIPEIKLSETKPLFVKLDPEVIKLEQVKIFKR
ncbi:methionine--tRNA ligase [Candidatus Roizmanbacteria bacterium RIFOXYB2_FULL_41_10]|uniref:Methionine--tRNA ligase n=1 Tax=Candidatus Roizmanbacteria bacterium RIFOXYA1_FULL_41_12 TaxID=1802082 RepID=A0A1F7KGN0_9BACT|nr:MAG: methionine--tRNA ligase [Candidatus Roizmanbacteria bacterium RIFOXYA1_FULL_41_12]OGK67606.1 MAG: methionine--tRNA ligase [Candidatus Roizmanbacteria bacterium RIFOXYA2_FULL_41_8]OGK71072.1 MAG: methionine--tRNA ligase [Candidatus Roizmanbacteria bacterium RIFOXYB2_FULL_41_10]OGK71692.1 MAG: methionine--tRNA ligase [Candidatus Roizmanbacteria bacterium RIFOXYC1_FULL_41_16]OGK72959.1 MAG: methionine--tRNA ligase [Candidatus Roizmanbacteria bacterium RIFOXYC2_FULL_41_10]OGK75014.1 MAG: m